MLLIKDCCCFFESKSINMIIKTKLDIKNSTILIKNSWLKYIIKKVANNNLCLLKKPNKKNNIKIAHPSAFLQYNPISYILISYPYIVQIQKESAIFYLLNLYPLHQEAYRLLWLVCFLIGASDEFTIADAGVHSRPLALKPILATPELLPTSLPIVLEHQLLYPPVTLEPSPTA